MSTHRLKRLMMPEEALVALLVDMPSPNGRFTLPRAVGLPKDAKAHHAFHDPNQRCFWIVIESEEFDEVEPGSLIPAINLEWEAVQFGPWEPSPAFGLATHHDAAMES